MDKPQLAQDKLNDRATMSGDSIEKSSGPEAPGHEVRRLKPTA